MRYFIGRIFHQLYFFKKSYFIIWAELMIGTVILGICANKLLTSQQAMQEVMQSMHGTPVLIEYERIEEYSGDAYVPLTYEQYQTVKAEFAGSLELSYASWIDLSAVWGVGDDEAVNWCLVFMDDALWGEIFDESREPGVVYAGECALDAIDTVCLKQQQEGDQLSIFDQGISFSVAEKEVSVGGQSGGVRSLPAARVAEIPTLHTGVFFDADNMRVWLKDCLIVPPDWMTSLKEGYDSPCSLKVGKDGEMPEFADADRLTARLGELNPGFAFNLSNVYLNLMLEQEDANWTAMCWLRIAIAVFLLVGGSLTGILLVLLYQRRRMKAVAFVCGSTRLGLEIETLTELVLLFTLAVVPGGALTWWLIKAGKVAIVPLRYFPESNFVLAGAAVAILAVVYLVVGMRERKISFMQILKGD